MGCAGDVLGDYCIRTHYHALGYSNNLWWLRLLALLGNLWVFLVLAMLVHGSLALATSPRYNDGILAYRVFLAPPTLPY